jgi:hypothetical protein
MFLSQDEVQEYEKQFQYYTSEAVKDIATKVERRLIEKMLALDDTPTEFKVVSRGNCGTTCPNSQAGGEHFVIEVHPPNTVDGYRYLCRCGVHYSHIHDQKFERGLIDSIVGVPEYILWAALFEGTIFKRFDRPTVYVTTDKMKDWVEMMKERHVKNILVQKQLEKTVKEKEELQKNFDYLNQKCVELNAKNVELHSIIRNLNRSIQNKSV